MKSCCTCKQSKDPSFFSRNKSREDGLQDRCKECVRNVRREKRIAAGLVVMGPKQTKEERLARAREYNRISQRSRKRRQENYEHVLEIERASRTKNKEKQRPFKNERQMRRARIQKEKSFLILPKELKKLYNQPCLFCNSKENQSIDHVIPLSRGGTHSIGNLITLCRSCNSKKSNKFMIEYMKVSKSLLKKGCG